MSLIINRKKRLIAFFVINASLAISGIALIALANFVSGTSLERITDCPMHMIFGLYCPLCGATRATGSLLRGDVISSFIYNPAILPAIIAFTVYDILTFRAILKNEKRIVYIHKAVWISLLTVLALNFVIRNALLLIWDIDYIAAMTF